VEANGVRGGRARLGQRLARGGVHAACARARVTRPPERERYMRAVEVERASAEAGPAVALIIPVVAAEDNTISGAPGRGAGHLRTDTAFHGLACVFRLSYERLHEACHLFDAQNAYSVPAVL
jgi:hypothetical protein